MRFQPRNPVCAIDAFSSLYGVPGPKPDPGVREMNWMLILALGTFQANRQEVVRAPDAVPGRYQGTCRGEGDVWLKGATPELLLSPI